MESARRFSALLLLPAVLLLSGCTVPCGPGCGGTTSFGDYCTEGYCPPPYVDDFESHACCDETRCVCDFGCLSNLGHMVPCGFGCGTCGCFFSGCCHKSCDSEWVPLCQPPAPRLFPVPTAPVFAR